MLKKIKSGLLQMLFFWVLTNLVCQPVLSATYSKTQNTPPSDAQSLSVTTGPFGGSDLKPQSGLDPSAATDANRIRLQQMKLSDQMLPSISVHILGDVLSPGVYPAKLSDKLSEMLLLAGSNRKKIRLVRLTRQNENKTILVDLYKYYFFGDLSQNPYLQDGDVIYVPENRGVVKVSGSVNRPDEYELNGEKNIFDLIKLAGGFSSSASNVSNVKVIRFAEEGKKNVLDVPNSDDDLKNFKIQKGDIVLVLNMSVAGKKFDYSVETMPGEKPFYPTSTPEVVVMGQVNNPGPYPFKPQLTVKDYVAYAGPDFDAKLGGVNVMRDGKKIRMKFEENLESGDMIIVKRKMQFKEYISFTSSSLALVLSVLVLENRLNN